MNRIIRRCGILTGIVALMVSVFLVPGVAVGMAAAAETPPAGGQTGVPDTGWYDAGENRFTINTADQLAGLSQLVNSGESFEEKTITLGADIDISVYGEGYNSGEGWIPIGDVTNRTVFRGVFDGAGHSINKLFVDSERYVHAGLFGYISKGAIQNLTLRNASLRSGATSEDPGYCMLGGVAGYANESSIVNCHFEGTVEGYGEVEVVGGVIGLTFDCDITDCSSSGEVKGEEGQLYVGGVAGFPQESRVRDSSSSADIFGASFVGGVAGYLYLCEVSESFSTGDVKAEGRYSTAGGVIGSLSESSVDSCYSEGKTESTETAGGVVGTLYKSSVTNSFSTGSVSSEYSYAGGVAGSLSDEASVSECYFKGEVSGRDYIGGVAGSIRNSIVQNCFSEGSVTGINEYVGGVVGSMSDSDVKNCYSTSEVMGYDRVGGVVGSSYGDCHIEDNAALNPAISADDERFGRIIGSGNDGGILSGNVAFAGMQVVVDGRVMSGEAELMPAATPAAIATHGESRSYAELRAEGGFPRPLTQAPWSYSPGKLPGLHGEPENMPAHITGLAVEPEDEEEEEEDVTGVIGELPEDEIRIEKDPFPGLTKGNVGAIIVIAIAAAMLGVWLRIRKCENRKRPAIIMAVAGVAAIVVTLSISLYEKPPTFSEEGMFIECRVHPSFGSENLMYSTVFQVYGEGRVALFAEPFSERYPDEICRMELQVDQNDIKHLQERIVGSGILQIDEVRQNNRVYDGNYYSITVNTDGLTHRVGGYEPSNSRFSGVFREVVDLVPEATIREMSNNVNEYLGFFDTGSLLEFSFEAKSQTGASMSYSIKQDGPVIFSAADTGGGMDFKTIIGREVLEEIDDIIKKEVDFYWDDTRGVGSFDIRGFSFKAVYADRVINTAEDMAFVINYEYIYQALLEYFDWLAEREYSNGQGLGSVFGESLDNSDIEGPVIRTFFNMDSRVISLEGRGYEKISFRLPRELAFYSAHYEEGYLSEFLSLYSSEHGGFIRIGMSPPTPGGSSVERHQRREIGGVLWHVNAGGSFDDFYLSTSRYLLHVSSWESSGLIYDFLETISFDIGSTEGLYDIPYDAEAREKDFEVTDSFDEGPRLYRAESYYLGVIDFVLPEGLLFVESDPRGSQLIDIKLREEGGGDIDLKVGEIISNDRIAGYIRDGYKEVLIGDRDWLVQDRYDNRSYVLNADRFSITIYTRQGVTKDGIELLEELLENISYK